MRTLRYILVSAFILFTSCDPTHNGFFENCTSDTIIIEIPDYLYHINPGILVTAYPEMKPVNNIGEQISIIESSGSKYLRTTLNSMESILISYSLGPSPYTDRNVEYKVISRTDTILLKEKDIFRQMKRRDGSRFKYFYSYE